MPLLSGSLATPKPPVRPTTAACSTASARRRRSRSSGYGHSAALCVDATSKQQPETQQPIAPAPESQSTRLKQLAATMTRPAASQAALRSFELLRSLLPRRFAELCKVHLSFVIDVPADFLDDTDDTGAAAAAGQTQWLWQRARDSMKLKRVHNTVASQTHFADVRDLAAVDRLLTRLASRPGVERVDGLFRKCGSVARQRRLLDGLWANTGEVSAEDVDEAWTAHDLAGALKVSLARLSEPLLTRRLLPYFQQVAQTTNASASSGDSDDGDNDGLSAVLTARRLKALRLLIQLLPSDRRALLGRLLALLSSVAEAAAFSRMPPENLGTVFGPALFYPMPEPAARDLAAGFNSAMAFLVRHAAAVMQVPDSVAQDADGILRRLRRCRAAPSALAADETAMPCLSVRFAECADVAVEYASPDGDADDFTRSQVAALYATVQAMPDSAKRRRLIRRFNRTNGGLPTAPTGAASSTPPTAAVYSASPSPLSAKSSTSTSGSPLISSPVFGRLFGLSDALSVS